MQCVLLCAGEGKRLRPLTDTTPKPLVPVYGEPIIAHSVRALPNAVDEIVLVVGYLQDQIRAYCGDVFQGRRVRYVEQENFSGGTGDALLCARGIARGKFLLLNGDDIYGAEALERIILEEHAMFGVRSDTPERFGVIFLNSDGTLKEIVEKPEHPQTNLININGLVVHDRIFNYNVETSRLGETLVTDMLTAYATDHPVRVIEQPLWLPVGYPEDIGKAEKVLKDMSVQ